VNIDPVSDFLRETLGILRDQREAISSRDWVSLERALGRLRHVMSAKAAIHGGVSRLRVAIEVLEGDEREQVRGLLEQIRAERQASSELIRLNLQRFQNLEAIFALDRSPTTDAPPKLGPGQRLSKWV
jgi:hypothetical protein